jgi:hypothetical protein
MECDRFKNLLKTWYRQVQNEALAPARMVSLMQQHIGECRICLMDPSVRQEVEKITEIVLPPPKARPSAPPTEVEEETSPVETDVDEESEILEEDELEDEDEDESF